jgi:hypothetical protein
MTLMCCKDWQNDEAEQSVSVESIRSALRSQAIPRRRSSPSDQFVSVSGALDLSTL